MHSQELFQLSQYLQEALHREQMLEQKLAKLQCLLATTQEASESSWQALIDEDRLLSRLEVMGNQLQSYSKNQTEDGMRKELVSLQEDKHHYEITAKESLRRVLQEKIEVARKLSEVEVRLTYLFNPPTFRTLLKHGKPNVETMDTSSAMLMHCFNEFARHQKSLH
uniref:Uncharacterized protein n=1 Tax=Hucho hucho TaxID=62062 RepID=A0A4W5KQ52_9TELE